MEENWVIRYQTIDKCDRNPLTVHLIPTNYWGLTFDLGTRKLDRPPRASFHISANNDESCSGQHQVKGLNF